MALSPNPYTLTLRANKGTALTCTEFDNNLRYFDTRDIRLDQAITALDADILNLTNSTQASIAALQSTLGILQSNILSQVTGSSVFQQLQQDINDLQADMNSLTNVLNDIQDNIDVLDDFRAQIACGLSAGTY